ncbi:hypothetical protein HDU79_011594 [Rhizoclosmatium sp. JEL0117]|nr:hypothetical protein HDU79_011594 [Rhizoclosmatium sp. JEL0117]
MPATIMPQFWASLSRGFSIKRKRQVVPATNCSTERFLISDDPTYPPYISDTDIEDLESDDSTLRSPPTPTLSAPLISTLKRLTGFKRTVCFKEEERMTLGRNALPEKNLNPKGILRRQSSDGRVDAPIENDRILVVSRVWFINSLHRDGITGEEDEEEEEEEQVILLKVRVSRSQTTYETVLRLLNAQLRGRLAKDDIEIKGVKVFRPFSKKRRGGWWEIKEEADWRICVAESFDRQEVNVVVSV